MQLVKIVAVCVFATLAGCGLVPRKSSGDILVVGDSVMAWNHGTLGAVIGADLDRDVVSRAALGASVRARAGASLLGLSIPDQLSGGNWNWIVMDGGANDLVGSCHCGNCDAEVTSLITQDGSSGDIPDLVAKARRSGAEVLWMGYYQAPESPSFKNCRPALVEMERRIRLYAKSHDGVHFVDAEEVFDPGDRSLLASDMTHPSRKGSTILGKFLARTISGIERGEGKSRIGHRLTTAD